MSILAVAATALTLFVAGQTLDPQRLAGVAKRAADAAIAKYADKGVTLDQIGITIAAVDRPSRKCIAGSFQGERPMYPASVVKLFYLAYLADRLEKNKVKLTPELERATHDMIVDSINDATGLVLETITGTTGGPELPPTELARWMDRRQAVNRWYAAKGYPKLNVCQKTWNEGPYGRERQGYGPNMELRNSLSPDVCVRLMSEIALDQVVSPDKCAWMRKYLSRHIIADDKDADDQSRNFSGRVLPGGTKLWSKAGWTSTVQHDVAFIQLPDGREFVYALFTKDTSTIPDLVPFLASQVLSGLGITPRSFETPK